MLGRTLLLASLLLAASAARAQEIAIPLADPDPAGNGAPSRLVGWNGNLYFAVRAPDGWALWRSDGTLDGTGPVTGGLGSEVALVGGETALWIATLSADGVGALWKSDGTAAGTRRVQTYPFYPTGMKDAGGILYFSDAVGGLHRSHGAAGATIRLSHLEPGFPEHDITPAAITRIGSLVFFRAVTAAVGTELWVTDGLAQGTHLTADINPDRGSFPSALTAFDGNVYFRADDGTTGHELWRSDGSSAGTVRVADIRPNGDAFPDNLRVLGDALYFSANDGTTGHELWRTDGTEAGTVRVKDVNPTGGSYPSALANVRGTLYFRADDGAHGAELWRSDGTDGGTVMVADIHPTGGSVPRSIVALDGTLVFTADDGVTGRQVWRSDGTPAGTARLTALDPGTGSEPTDLRAVGSRVFFVADDGVHGPMLWTVTRCGNRRLDAGETCDDGNAEDGDCCAADCTLDDPGTACGPDEQCSDGACDAAGACLRTPVSGVCDDDDVCTVDDVCGAASCGGTPRNCADEDPCTVDSCNPEYGCANEPLGFAALRSLFAPQTSPAACRNTKLPAAVRKRMVDARALVAGAETTSTRRRMLARAIRRLGAARRAVRRARRLGPECRAALLDWLDDARTRASCLLP